MKILIKLPNLNTRKLMFFPPDRSHSKKLVSNIHTQAKIGIENWKILSKSLKNKL